MREARCVHTRPAANALPRASRLARKKDYAAVFKNGRRSADRHFMVLYRPNGLGHGRLGLAITRRRLRGAVRRNQVKRKLRESFRLHQGMLAGIDVVVLAQPGLADADAAAIRSSLTWHWHELQVRSSASCAEASGATNAS